MRYGRSPLLRTDASRQPFVGRRRARGAGTRDGWRMRTPKLESADYRRSGPRLAPRDGIRVDSSEPSPDSALELFRPLFRLSLVFVALPARARPRRHRL